MKGFELNMDLVDKKYITIDGKEFVITTKFKDKKYGEIIKAVSRELKDFERMYFIKNNGVYEKVSDPKMLKYFLDTYETARDDIIF